MYQYVIVGPLVKLYGNHHEKKRVLHERKVPLQFEQMQWPYETVKDTETLSRRLFKRTMSNHQRVRLIKQES